MQKPKPLTNKHINTTKKQKQIIGTSHCLLPHDLIVEILSWMPMKPLTRLKCVSKQWLKLISNDPDFIKLLHERSNELFLVWPSSYPAHGGGIIVKSLELNDALEKGNNIDNRTEQHWLDNTCGTHDTIIVGSSYDFVCIVVLPFWPEATDFKYVLYNPLTRVEKILPDPPLMIAYPCVFGLGYDTMTDDYKVMLIQKLKTGSGTTSYYVQVYSLKADQWVKSSWACSFSFGIAMFRKGIRDICRLRFTSTFVNNAFHWPATFWEGDWVSPESKIVCLSLHDERFCETPLPNFGRRPTPPECGTLELAVLRGRLHLLVDNVDLWVMEEYGVKESWTKLYSLPNMEEGVVIIRPIVYWKLRSEILFEKEVEDGRESCKVLFSLDLKNQTINNLGVCLDFDKVRYHEVTLATVQGHTEH